MRTASQEAPLSSQFAWCIPLFLLIVALGLVLGAGAAYLAASICVALFVYRNPVDGLWCAFGVLALGEVLLPLGPDTDFGAEAPISFWFWGLALGVTTTAAFLAVGRRGYAPVNWKRVPGPLLWTTWLFGGSLVVSIIYGILAGDGLAASLRQATGPVFLLVFAYLTLRLSLSSDDFATFVKRTEWIMFAYAIIYTVHYLPHNIGNGDFVRERSPILFFAGLFGANVLLATLIRRQWRNRWAATLYCVVFSAAILLSGFRSPLVVMLVTVIVMFAVEAVRSRLKLLIFAGLLFGAIALNPVQQVDRLLHIVGLHPDLAQRFTINPLNDSSFQGRVSELLSIQQELREHPLLGKGMGSSFEWFEPELGTMVTTSFVDSGVGFILLKMGLLGLAVFVCWATVILHSAGCLWRAELNYQSLICLSAMIYYVFFLLLGPSFFQFVFSPWAGVVIGYLCLASSKAEETSRS